MYFKTSSNPQYSPLHVIYIIYFDLIQLFLTKIIFQGENIADNGGLREAFIAYQKFVEKNGEEPRLPGLENYDPYQLFFISSASIWCEYISPDTIVDLVLHGTHLPNEYRAKGPLHNSEEFSSVWGCSKKDKMNPSRKCVVW